MSAIVVGAVNNAGAKLVAGRAAELARHLGLSLHVVCVVTPTDVEHVRCGADQWTVDSLAVCEEFVRALSQEFGQGLEVTSHVGRGPVVSVLCDEAKRVSAEMVVVGSRRSRIGELVYGTVAHRLARRAECDVVVVPTADRTPWFGSIDPNIASVSFMG